MSYLVKILRAINKYIAGGATSEVKQCVVPGNKAKYIRNPCSTSVEWVPMTGDSVTPLSRVIPVSANLCVSPGGGGSVNKSRYYNKRLAT